jgi:hypothetical protein
LGGDAAAAKRVCSVRKRGVHPFRIAKQPARGGCGVAGGWGLQEGARGCLRGSRHMQK